MIYDIVPSTNIFMSLGDNADDEVLDLLLLLLLLFLLLFSYSSMMMTTTPPTTTTTTCKIMFISVLDLDSSKSRQMKTLMEVFQNGFQNIFVKFQKSSFQNLKRQLEANRFS